MATKKAVMKAATKKGAKKPVKKKLAKKRPATTKAVTITFTCDGECKASGEHVGRGAVILAAEGTNAAWVTWYTEGEPRGLRLARITPTRTERGLRWEPVNVYMVDDRKEAQHPSLATLSSGRPFVVFEGPTPEGGRALFARVMGRKGLSQPVRFTTATRADRPVPTRWGLNGVLIAWKEQDEMGPRIALAEWKGL